METDLGASCWPHANFSWLDAASNNFPGQLVHARSDNSKDPSVYWCRSLVVVTNFPAFKHYTLTTNHLVAKFSSRKMVFYFTSNGK